jgi:hypothetical protein
VETVRTYKSSKAESHRDEIMVNWEIKRDRNNPDLIDENSLDDVLSARQFECSVRWPLYWKDKANLLLRAAEKIFVAYDAAYKRELERDLAVVESHDMEGEELEDFLDSRLLEICLLLKGYAVENLLKGIIFSQNRDRLKESDYGSYLDGEITKHHLDELYVCAELAKNKDAIDPETKEILKILENMAVWQGRYPTALNLERNKQKKQIPNSLRDQGKINELCIRLFGVLNDIPTPPTHLSERT